MVRKNDYRICADEKTKEAFQRIASFFPDKNKKEVIAEIISNELKKYKGKKPPVKKAAKVAKPVAKKPVAKKTAKAAPKAKPKAKTVKK